jgi:hypothetical protein
MLQCMPPRLALLRCDPAPDAPEMVRILWGGAADLSRALLAFLRVQGVARARYDGETHSWLVAVALLPDVARYFLASQATPRRKVRTVARAA